MTYPKLWKLTCTLNSPADATEEEVRRVLRVHLPRAVTLVSVEPMEEEEEKNEAQGFSEVP